jgi:hypothetical protein
MPDWKISISAKRNFCRSDRHSINWMLAFTHGHKRQHDIKKQRVLSS